MLVQKAGMFMRQGHLTLQRYKQTRTDTQKFRTAVWQYYNRHGRHDLPWRQPEPDGAFDPYKIMLSEIMLQQTQVNRVTPKYTAFIAQFPSLEQLASTELGDVLRAWQGLGYNRRAKFLWQAAREIMNSYEGCFPSNETELVKLPGIGKNTARAILAYAFSQPVTYVETNIRTVFIYHYFSNHTEIHDREILAQVQATLPQEASHIRQWYWALMDYGAYLKQTKGNLNKLSKHYVKQSAFHGSKRQVRGAVLRTLSVGPAALPFLQQNIPDIRLRDVLTELEQEGLIQNKGGMFSL